MTIVLNTTVNIFSIIVSNFISVVLNDKWLSKFYSMMILQYLEYLLRVTTEHKSDLWNTDFGNNNPEYYPKNIKND